MVKPSIFLSATTFLFSSFAEMFCLFLLNEFVHHWHSLEFPSFDPVRRKILFLLMIFLAT